MLNSLQNTPYLFFSALSDRLCHLLKYRYDISLQEGWSESSTAAPTGKGIDHKRVVFPSYLNV